MRKLTVLAIAALSVVSLGVFASAAGAVKGTDSRIDPTFSADFVASPAKKSTKKKATALALEVTTDLGAWTGITALNTKAGAYEPMPPEAKTAQVFLPKGIKINNKQFPTCSESVIQTTRDVNSCPKGSILGTGLSVATAYDPVRRIVLTYKICAKTYGIAHKKGIMLVSQAKPGEPANAAFGCASPTISTTQILIGSLQSAGGKYGKLINIPITLASPVPGGVVVINKFNVKLNKKITKKVKGKKTTYGFLEAPTTCPKEGWAFAAQFNFPTFPQIGNRRGDALQPCK